ncbi:MAG: spore maturation protein [Prevotellaceae bacterium]|jgi:spore maturation protein SpmA|nr:spore maturation protein [Prevotellaceae bacterium]
MVLNYIWVGFFLVAFAVALVKAFAFGDAEIFTTLMGSTFESAKTAFELSLGLTGVLSLWLGFMKIGERGGIVAFLSRLAAPVFRRLFPDLPKNHPANGSIFMNLSANMLGLDNAATPLGLKAMQQMQELNPQKDRATNPMIMFLALNTSGLTLIPISVMVYRAQMGAANPSDVFLPILIATYCSTLAAVVTVCLYQKINLLNRSTLLFFGGLTAAVALLTFFFSSLPKDKVGLYSAFGANLLLLAIVVGFIVAGVRKRINVYEAFVDGAKEGFKTAVTIIPYLVAMLVAVGMLRASGAMDALVDGIAAFFGWMGVNADFVGALPTALMKPLSGSGARGMMVDAMRTYGADSFTGRLASTIQGATDTTFYILAVYFGSVGVKHTRYAVTCGLIADMVGIVAAILVAYVFFA